MAQRKPNILITGTPGVGKSTIAEAVAQQTGLKYVNVGRDLIDAQTLYSERDEERDCTIFDEDQVLDEMEGFMAEGGNVIDFHSSDFFPERFFDLVFVLRTNNEVLYERLEERGYSQKKVQENIEAEIMQVVLDEAVESYRREIIHILENNTLEDLDKNVEQITDMIKKTQV